MKVVHLSTAAFPQSACYRLHSALLQEGIDSKILVLQNYLKLDKTAEILDNLYRKVKWKLGYKLHENKIKHLKAKTIFSLGNSGFSLINHPLIREADIINLHWVNGGFMSIEDIGALISLDKKVFYTLHDRWALTGGCHITYGCEGYTEGCLTCPHIQHKSLTAEIYNRKQKEWDSEKLRLIAPSTWMRECAKASLLFKNTRVEVIPNPIDINIFNPTEEVYYKKELGIEDKLVIGFGAVGAASVPYKGFSYLLDALKLLVKNSPWLKEKLHILVVGSEAESNLESLDIPMTFLGLLQGEDIMSRVYNSFDIFVCPSIEDNLPNMVMEALSCGVPVAAFDTGGIKDMVKHKQNGYLAEYKNAEDLAEGIQWVINNIEDYESELSENARNHVLDNYKYSTIAKKYISYYKE